MGWARPRPPRQQHPRRALLPHLTRRTCLPLPRLRSRRRTRSRRAPHAQAQPAPRAQRRQGTVHTAPRSPLPHPATSAPTLAVRPPVSGPRGEQPCAAAWRASPHPSPLRAHPRRVLLRRTCQARALRSTAALDRAPWELAPRHMTAAIESAPHQTPTSSGRPAARTHEAGTRSCAARPSGRRGPS